jgi:hypothetical protein
MMRSIVGTFVIESDIQKQADGTCTVWFGVRRLVETGLPLSKREQEQLAFIERTLDDVARAAGVRTLGPSGVA